MHINACLRKINQIFGLKVNDLDKVNIMNAVTAIKAKTNYKG